jgi:hypothetical protein
MKKVLSKKTRYDLEYFDSQDTHSWRKSQYTDYTNSKEALDSLAWQKRDFKGKVRLIKIVTVETLFQ